MFYLALSAPGDKTLARRYTVTAVLLVVAWVLMVSYQLFTPNAVGSVASALSKPIPALASMLTSESGSSLAVFICSFAGMFVLSAWVSLLMFGKERRLSIQFCVSLVLTLIGTAILGLLKNAGLDLSSPSVLSQPFGVVFGNPAFAFFYLALPFIAMVVYDFRSKLKLRKKL
jgi:hypothetical protein